jgi:Na+-transporting NADH:ubiquinone oxidoreductase subunit NqrF
MRQSSIPAKVARADQKDLKPSIGRIIRLINRWSCSIILFKYLHWRIFTRLFSSLLYCLIAEVLAPLKSMVVHLLKNRGWQEKVRFWCGARNQPEILYRETFETLAKEHENFEWQVALSEATDDLQWQGHRGFIHQAIFEEVLKNHSTIQECEFYVCGPPSMLAATRRMLRDLGVSDASVRFDDFGK